MQGRNKYTKIRHNKVLDAWLKKANYPIPFSGIIKVPTEEFGKLLVESQRSHPNYDEESHIAWAAYNCLMRHVKPKESARARPTKEAVLLETLAKTRTDIKSIGRILILILLALTGILFLGALEAFGQVNHFPLIIEMQDGGVRQGLRGSGLIVLDCTSNLTCTFTEATSTLDISASGAAGAPSTLEYLVLTLDAGLSAERNFVAGVGIGSVDGGADGPFTVSLDLSELVANQVIFDGGQASQTITFSLSGATDPVVTLADGVFNVTTGTIQQNGDDVIHKATNTLLSTENVILDGSANPRDITLGIIRILQTPNMNSTRGIAIITNAAGFGDTKSLEIDWTATGVAAGDFEAVIDLDIDTANSTGGNIIALEITETTTGSATTYGMLTGVGVNPIITEAGTFGDIETAFTFDSGFTDVTAAFNSTGTDVQMFVANGDLVYIGMAAVFDEVEFILAVVASNAGVKPTFEYSDGATGWIAFSPTDNTNGMRQNGDLVWIASELAGWAQDTVNAVSSKFWIRITRTAVTVATPPTEDLVQVNGDLEFKWDSSGNLNIASVTSGFNDETADAGFIRCENAQICMAWELATPGADKTLIVDASDILQFNGAFNATTLTEGGTQVVLESRALTGGDGIETLGDLSSDRTVTVDLNATVDGVGSSSNLSGMEFTATGELALLQDCADTQILKYTTTGDLWECQNDNDSGGAPAWEALVNTADTATLYTSSNVLELMDYNFTASYSGTDIGFQVSQLTGNPLTGSILVDFRAADADIVVFRAGDGTNGITVDQAGALTAEGTGAITATVGDSATAFFTSGEIEKLHLPDVEGLDTALTADRCVRINTGGTALEAAAADCNSGSGANTALSNLAAVAINLPLLPDAAAADDFGSATLPFKDLFFAGSSGTPGTNNFRITGASTSGTRVFTVVDAASNSVVPNAGSANNFVTAIAATGVVSIAQPAFTDISGTATAGQVPNLESLNGTLDIASGGTGAAAKEAAMDALSPVTTEGDIIMRNATVNTRLARGANGECLTSNTTTILWGSCGGGVSLDAITAAGGTSSINNGDNAIVWNWSLTTAAKNAFTFTEDVASVAATDPVIVNIATLAASTAHPLEVTARGTANGFRVGAADGILIELGTGGVDFGALLNYPTACSAQFVRAILDTPTCETVVLTTDVSGILPGANGGTGNGFFAVAGPTTSLKTFTYPDASAVVLTDDAAVTNAQGGTGIDTSSSIGVVRVDSGTTTVTELSGDVATSGSNATLIQAGVVASAELAAANKLLTCNFVLFDDTGLSDTDDIPSVGNCTRPGRAITITAVFCESDAGTPEVDIFKDDGTAASILTGTITCSSSGVAGTIDTGEDNFAVTDRMDFVMVASSTADRVSMAIQYVVD